MEIENVSQKLSSSGRTLVHFAEVCQGGTSGQNSLRRTHEVARTVGFREAARWIRRMNPSLWYQESTWTVDRDSGAIRSFRGFGVCKSRV
jgi:hypothetical protein